MKQRSKKREKLHMILIKLLNFLKRKCERGLEWMVSERGSAPNPAGDDLWTK